MDEEVFQRLGALFALSGDQSSSLAPHGGFQLTITPFSGGQIASFVFYKIQAYRWYIYTYLDKTLTYKINVRKSEGSDSKFKISL